MKEGDEWSRRGPQGSPTFDDRSVAISDWASLLPELVQGIADCVLSTTGTGGVDAYMDMRAVCPSWRSAIAKPSPLAAVADLRFRPRQWVMVDLIYGNNDCDACLFLHAPTGRFRCLRLPVLRDHIVVCAADGLLVLGDREPPHLARVLNPFTGDMLHFAAPLPKHYYGDLAYTSVDGGSHSTLAFLRWGKLLCAAPTSHVFTEKNFTHTEKGMEYLVSLVNFHGNVYCSDALGCVYKFVAPVEQCDGELVVIARVSIEGDDREFGSYLVESAGELLLIRYVGQSLKVFRVNIEHKLLEEVKSLGGRTLFIGDQRCVSVDADKLPSVDRECIYILSFENNRDVWVYDLRGDRADIIERYFERPFTLVQVLLRYCNKPNIAVPPAT